MADRGARLFHGGRESRGAAPGSGYRNEADAITGRVDATKVNSTLDELLARFRELRSRGEGYLEVATSDRAYPAVMIGFRNGRGVVHVAEARDSLALVRGDNSVPADEEVEVPILDEPAVFSGEMVMTLDHARQFVEEFARTDSVGGYENWFQS